MSESPFAELTAVEELSPEQILNQLFSRKKKAFHTQIEHPLPITVLELIASDLKEYKCENIIKKFVDNFKTNMVAYKRQRAREIVDAYVNINKIKEEKQQQLKELLLGR